MVNKNKEKFYFFLTGIFMGIADPIPGVSAGTIAFVSGIYTRLIASLSIMNLYFFKNLCRFRIKKIVKIIDWAFLLPVGCGLLLALISTANIIHFLLLNYPFYLWSLFFGLVLFSTIFFLKNISWKIHYVIFLLLGIVLGYWFAGLQPIQNFDNYIFLIFVGFFAVSCLLLPGVSGAFVLVILGQYELIISAVKNPFNVENLIILLYFYIGAVAGLLITSRLLNWLIKKWEFILLCFLSGITLGSLRKIWPWKAEIGTLETTTIVNILPSFDKNTIFALIFIFLGTLFAIMLYKLPNIFKKTKC